MENKPHFNNSAPNPERVIFEADLLRGGAEYTPDGVLLVTKEQSDSITRELAKAEEEVVKFENPEFNQHFNALTEAYATPEVIVAFNQLETFFTHGSIQDVRADLWRSFMNEGSATENASFRFYSEAVTPLIEVIWPTLVETYRFARKFQISAGTELYKYIESGPYGDSPNGDHLRAVTELMLRYYPKTPLEAIQDEVDLRRLRAHEKVSRITGTKQI